MKFRVFIYVCVCLCNQFGQGDRADWVTCQGMFCMFHVSRSQYVPSILSHAIEHDMSRAQQTLDVQAGFSSLYPPLQAHPSSKYFIRTTLSLGRLPAFMAFRSIVSLSFMLLLVAVLKMQMSTYRTVTLLTISVVSLMSTLWRS